MTENICNIAENVNRLKFEVNELCAKLGKDADTIQIMGVSKTKTAQDVEKAIKAARGDKKFQAEVDVLTKAKATLEAGKSIRTMELNDDEAEIIRQTFLLTSKPVIYVGNVSEDEIATAEENEYFKKIAIGNIQVLTDFRYRFYGA